MTRTSRGPEETSETETRRLMAEPLSPLAVLIILAGRAIAYVISKIKGER
jgi:hypothetical protein